MALAVAGLMGVGGLTALATGVASAAAPTFPDNLVVFPNRDFVTVEGYQDHLGETATVEVKRAGVVVGSAKSVVGPGDVAFEINQAESAGGPVPPTRSPRTSSPATSCPWPSVLASRTPPRSLTPS